MILNHSTIYYSLNATFDSVTAILILAVILHVALLPSFTQAYLDSAYVYMKESQALNGSEQDQTLIISFTSQHHVNAAMQLSWPIVLLGVSILLRIQNFGCLFGGIECVSNTSPFFGCLVEVSLFMHSLAWAFMCIYYSWMLRKSVQVVKLSDKKDK